MKDLLVWVAVMVVAIVGGAAAWVQFSDPAEWQVFGGRLVMDEQSAGAEIGVTATFVVVGLIAGLVIGLVLQAVFKSDWTGTVVFGITAVIAGLAAWQLGMWWGPDDPSTVSGLTEGDTVPDQLAVEGIAPFFAWPIGAMAGILVGSLFNRVPDQSDMWIADSGYSDDGRAIAATDPSVNDTKS